jgi:hypothetical protein
MKTVVNLWHVLLLAVLASVLVALVRGRRT